MVFVECSENSEFMCILFLICFFFFVRHRDKIKNETIYKKYKDNMYCFIIVFVLVQSIGSWLAPPARARARARRVPPVAVSIGQAHRLAITVTNTSGNTTDVDATSTSQTKTITSTNSIAATNAPTPPPGAPCDQVLSCAQVMCLCFVCVLCSFSDFFCLFVVLLVGVVEQEHKIFFFFLTLSALSTTSLHNTLHNALVFSRRTRIDSRHR